MLKNDWLFCQDNSDEILSIGLKNLKISNIQNKIIDISPKAGNYLFSYDKKPMYIGEASSLLNRIKQQRKPKASTFYKNYLKKIRQLDFENELSIDEFDLQIIDVSIGRKELEEFGIVNLPTPLNKFQLGKRNIFEKNANNELWIDIQDNYSNIIKDGSEMILNQKFTSWNSSNAPKEAGLYLVKDSNEEFIYIGESSNVFDRFKTHSGDTYFSAFRRNLGTGILGFNLKEKNGRKRYFDNYENLELDNYIRSCKISMSKVQFGRFELEEHLIRTLNPLLNRKSKKS